MSLTKQNLIDAFKVVEEFQFHEYSVVYMPAQSVKDLQEWSDAYNRNEAEKSNAVWIKDKTDAQ